MRRATGDRVATLSDELFLLQRAARVCWWRWRSEEKRLRNKCVVDPFTLHRHELGLLYATWRETREEAGLPHRHEDLPIRVRRHYERVAWRKCREFLRTHPS